MTRDCDRFNASLLALAYGELPPDTADALRSHAAGCLKCRDALERILLTRKLAATLPVLDPGDDMDNSILAAAASAAAASRSEGGAQPTQSTAPVTVRASKRERSWFLPALRGFLLRPAVATAMLALLVCTMSFFLANEHWLPSADTPVVPNEPLATDNESSKASANKSQLPGQAPDIGAPAKPVIPEREAAKNKGTGVAAATPYQGPARPLPKRKSRRRPSPGSGAAGSMPSPKMDALSDIEAAPQAPALANTDVQFAEEPVAAGAAVSKRPGQANKKASVPDLQPDVRDAFDRGMAAFARGDCQAAVHTLIRSIDILPSHSSSIPVAIHHIARCEKRRGRFARAVVWYGRLLDGFGSYAKRPEALWEAAACHRRLGQNEKARDRLMALREWPAWQGRALQALDQLPE